MDESTPFKKIEGEIDEIKWISAEELLSELKSQPEIYCPWMLIALELLEKSEKSMLEKYGDIFKPWMNTEIHKIFQQAIKLHLPDDNWRLVQ